MDFTTAEKSASVIANIPFLTFRINTLYTRQRALSTDVDYSDPSKSVSN